MEDGMFDSHFTATYERRIKMKCGVTLVGLVHHVVSVATERCQLELSGKVSTKHAFSLAQS